MEVVRSEMEDVRRKMFEVRNQREDNERPAY
jgi:hypothetical protein